ncbi:MAG: VOC family protein [Flammeovirgaceae bacterium]
MKSLFKSALMIAGIAIALIALFSLRTFSQSKSSTVALNAGIVTSKLRESKDFYQRVLNFEVVFENDFYLLMRTPDGKDQLSFLLPNHVSQQPVFRPPFAGKGLYLTLEVEDVDAAFERISKLIAVEFAVRNEPWGDRHFAIVDPNGIGIDIVTYQKPNAN